MADQRRTDERIIGGLRETTKTVGRLMLTLSALGAFALLALGRPDASLLDPAATVSVPSVGATTSRALLIVGPLLLIALRVYLQIYVEHWRRLDAIVRRRKLARDFVVSPLRHPVLRVSAGAVLYLLVPLVFAAFTWKAMALPRTWGHGLLAATIFVIAAHALQNWRRSWTARLAVCAVLTVLGVVGVRPFLGDLQRPLDLRYADLREIDLAGANLRQADLRQANLSDADLNGADLEGAKLGRAELAGTDLGGAILRDVDFEKALLRGSNLTGADLRGANLTETDLSETTGMEADLRGASLRRTNLRHADFRSADFRGAELSAADLGNAELSEANFEATNLITAKLKAASLVGANLQRARLMAADLGSANLYGTRLRGAILVDATLEGARLLWTDLSEAVIEQTQLDAACGNDKTVLPEGLRIPACPSDPPAEP